MILFIIVLCFILIMFVYLYVTYKKNNENEEIYTEEEIIDNSPLSEQTFKNLSLYADKKQDSRTDAIMHNLDVIKFWVIIIGIYFLVKIFVEVIKIATIASAGYKINELLKYIL